MLRCLLPAPLLAAICCLAGATPAQSPEKEPPELPLDAKARGQVIDQLLKELDDNYVFPKVAKEMRESIRGRADKKEYDSVKTGQELAKLLTRHLQEMSKDKHLRVYCSTKKLALRPKGKPDDKEIARFRAMQKKLNAGFRRVERLAGHVGYLALEGFMDHEGGGKSAAAV